jgi:diphosphomevalonate decarboxylase
VKIRASAPSNIALIKYMGKSDAARNLPANPSLSLTLQDFRSISNVESSPTSESRWEWVGEGLTEKERARALVHAARTEASARQEFARLGIPVAAPALHRLACVNDFPARAGVASSASSFASITLAAIGACDIEGIFRDRYAKDESLRSWSAGLSREGSGSSCRSFGGPYVRWEGEEIREIPSSLPPLIDLLLVVEDAAKEVSSSEAHRRCVTSPLFANRAARATERCALVERALAIGDHRSVAAAAWTEAWEMHSLFHTATPSFTYFRPRTLEALRWSYRSRGERP